MLGRNIASVAARAANTLVVGIGRALRSSAAGSAKADAQKRDLHSQMEDREQAMVFGDAMPEYKFEFELRELVVRWLTETLGCDVVADELTLGDGYPDLVATTIDRLDERKLQSLDPVVAVNDFVRLIEGMAEAPIDAFGNLIAVELKLKDWRKALGQACRYRTFASQTYIAIPAERATAEVLNAAAGYGVGVVAVSDVAEVVLPARSGLPHDPLQKGWASELVLAQFLGHRPARRLAGTRGGGITAMAS